MEAPVKVIFIVEDIDDRIGIVRIKVVNEELITHAVQQACLSLSHVVIERGLVDNHIFLRDHRRSSYSSAVILWEAEMKRVALQKNHTTKQSGSGR